MIPYSDKSIPLITFDAQKNYFNLSQQAAEFLCTIKRPVAVVSIAGLYRTGKSFLINRMIKNRDKTDNHYFKVGGTTQSVTKGLSIWGSPITVADNDGKQVDYLLIDSEGIGSCQQNNKYDTSILVFLFLISSTVVYNSLNAIDELGLQQLQVVLEFKKCIQGNRQLNPAPKFIWVLRDFALQLVDQDGRQLTANEYLQKCLQQSNAKGIETRKKNQIRKAIKQSLGKRSCYTLVRPTIKQQDLQSFTENRPSRNHKIRAEFLSQVEELKGQIFSGKKQDIKVIGGEKITGRTLYKVIESYISIINDGQLPNVSNIWDSLISNKDEQVFDKCIDKLKSELQQIALPLSRQQLKLRINETQNRIYRQLQSQLPMKISQYYKRYLQISQKFNTEIKNRNQSLRSNQLLSQLRNFVKESVDYESISPLNISSVLKNLLGAMKFKANGSASAYEYLLSVISDIMFIVEQKAQKTKRQNGDARLIIDKLESDKKQVDLQLIAIKKEYHESLKTISKFQESQAKIEKDYVLLKSKAYEYQNKYKDLQTMKEHEACQHQKRYNQQIQRLKCKLEELNESLKKQKMNNHSLSQELQSIKESHQRNLVKERKQIIFEEKMQQVYNKFAKEKQGIKKQVDKYRQQVEHVTHKYQQVLAAYQEGCQRQQSMKVLFEKKQQNFLKQLEKLKICIKDTKQSYQSTYKTKQNNDQALRDLENLTSVKKKENAGYNTSETKQECNERDYALLKNYYESQLQRVKQDANQYTTQLSQKVLKLQSQISEQIYRRKISQEESRQYKQKCTKLQIDITEANKKFTNCMKQIEEARQNQRKLYQESIVRLLKNMQKKSVAYHYSSHHA